MRIRYLARKHGAFALIFMRQRGRTIVHPRCVLSWS